MDQPLTLWQKIQADIKAIGVELGADLSKLEASIKTHFESHAAAAVPDTVSGTTPSAASVLDTTPTAPPAQ